MTEETVTKKLQPVTPGETTTEFDVAKRNSVWGVVGIVLGSVLSFGSTIMEAIGQDTKWGIVAGAVIAVAGALQKMLVGLGYIKSRTDIKVASSNAQAAKSLSENK